MCGIASSTWLLAQPGRYRGIVVDMHRGDDHVVGTRGMRLVEAGEVLRGLDLQCGKEHHRSAARRHDLHLRHAGALQHRMRQQEIGHFGAFVQREHRDHRPARATRLQGLDERLLLAFAHDRRILLRGRQRRADTVARQPQGCNTCSRQRPSPPHCRSSMTVMHRA